MRCPPRPEGNPVELYSINNFGQLTSTTDANGNVTQLVYDANGYLDKVTRAFGTTLSAPTEFDPDAVGRPTVLRDANGHTTQLAYNAWNRLETRIAPAPFLYETEYSYDPSGNLAQIDEQSEIPGDPQTTTFVYNVRDWLLTVTNELSQTTTYGYDGRGNRQSTTDPELNVVNRVFDERNKLYTETAANGDQVKLHYRPNSRLATVIDGNGNETAYDYDDFDRQSMITYEDSTSEGRSYDAASNVIGTTTRSGSNFTYVYDDLHRLRSRTTPEETATFTYDLAGRMTAAVNPAATLAYAYNARNQLITETTTLPGLSVLVVQHQYDGIGNRTRLTFADANYVTYAYDELGRLEFLRDNGTADLSEWTWDALSRPATRMLPSGVSSVWTYDEASRVATITHSDSNSAIDARTYSRDPTGTITSLTDRLGAHTYGYDASKQLASVDYPPASPFADTSWTYDDAGNRVTETSTTTTTYVANALNQYASVGGVTQVQDANGNLINDGTNTYTFDSQSRLLLAQVDDGSGGTVTVSYAYDPFMRRVRKAAGGTVIYFLWSGSDLLEEYDANTLREVRYLHDGGSTPVHLVTDNSLGVETVYDVHHDHLGAPRTVTDPTEDVAWQAEYSTFGTTSIAGGNSIVLNMGLPGQYFDVETGFHYNRFRYYNSTGGRYLSADPIGQAATINLYRYAFDNPLSWIDPYGLDILVIENGPTSGNPFGHTALAITGEGVYSVGNGTDAGSSLYEYLARDSPRRDTKLTSIPTTPEEDRAALEYLRRVGEGGLGKFTDNCSSRSNNALDAAGVPQTLFPDNVPGSAGDRAEDAGGASTIIPKNTPFPSGYPLSMRQFEPRSSPH